MSTVATAADTVASDASRLRRTLSALLVVELFSGFQQGYFVPLFPIISDHYRIGLTALSWTVTGPALAAAVATPVLTALGDRHGHRRVLRATVTVVALGAVLIAIAPDYPVLLAGRVFQGCLAGFLPLMFGLVRERHDGQETRRAIAYLSGALMLGVLLGNACASKLHSVALWAAAAGTLAGLGLLVRLRDPGSGPDSANAARRPTKIDWRGAALLAAGLVAMLLALDEGGAWGWGSPPLLGCAGLGLALLAAWVAAELRTGSPLVDVRRFFRPRLLPVFVVGWCVHFVVIGGQVSYSTYFTWRGGLALPASSVGLILLPAFCAMALFSALTIRIGRVLGYRRVVVLGAALLTAGSISILLRHDGAADFAVLLALSGAGMGLISGAGRILVVDSVRAEETATSEGLFELLVTLGSAAGSAVLAAVLALGAGGHDYRAAWAVSAGVAVAGLLAASALSRVGREG